MPTRFSSRRRIKRNDGIELLIDVKGPTGLIICVVLQPSTKANLEALVMIQIIQLDGKRRDLDIYVPFVRRAECMRPKRLRASETAMGISSP